MSEQVSEAQPAVQQIPPVSAAAEPLMAQAQTPIAEAAVGAADQIVQTSHPITQRFFEVIGKKVGPYACDYCKESHADLSKKPPMVAGKIPYAFFDVDHDDGEKALQQVGLSREKGISMPVIKDCTREVDSNTLMPMPDSIPKCKVYQGYDPGDFQDLDNWDP